MLSIPAGNPSPWTGPEGNNTYLLSGSVPTLIDAGVGEPSHIDAVARALADVPLAQILITHSHPDHARGVPALMSRWPGVLVRNLAPDQCVDNESIAGGSLVQYLDSLRRIRALSPRRLLPGHGPVIDDPVTLIDKYLAHRAER